MSSIREKLSISKIKTSNPEIYVFSEFLKFLPRDLQAKKAQNSQYNYLVIIVLCFVCPHYIVANTKLEFLVDSNTKPYTKVFALNFRPKLVWQHLYFYLNLSHFARFLSYAGAILGTNESLRTWNKFVKGGRQTSNPTNSLTLLN